MKIPRLALAAMLTIAVAGAEAWPQAAPKGDLQGSAVAHTEKSAIGVIDGAQLALPAKAAGGMPYFGKWKDRPGTISGPVPVVVFLHGSSGLKLAAIADWQKWLSEFGIASVAPDSFALPDRLTYTSPIARSTYERIHELRASEIAIALAALKQADWVDPSRIVLAGTSEGATAVARDGNSAFAARIVFSWSCEDNYFVEAHRTRVVADQPILNVISSVDPFFSPANSWLDNPRAAGHCAAALAESKRAVVVLVPGAPHTLINLPYVRATIRAFLEVALGLGPK